jgi:hypothetical protein
MNEAKKRSEKRPSERAAEGVARWVGRGEAPTVRSELEGGTTRGTRDNRTKEVVIIWQQWQGWNRFLLSFPYHHHLITSSVSRSGPEASLRDVTRGGGDKVVRWVKWLVIGSLLITSHSIRSVSSCSVTHYILSHPFPSDRPFGPPFGSDGDGRGKDNMIGR